jgi:hypothetical protein
MPSRATVLGRLKENLQNRMDRESRKKAAMEAEKVKIQDEKDMSNVQGAKDGGRIGLKHGSYKDKANPHIDQKVYVTKSGKEEASVVDKDSVIKNKKKQRMAREVPNFKQGGRAMYKSGSKGCKLAMKGKGRAYGKNS